MAPALALAQGTGPTASSAKTMWITPTIEGLGLCETALKDPKITYPGAAYAKCKELKDDGASVVTRLLDELEPGGPKGRVQVGYTATLQLLSLYRQTPQGWAIDTDKADAFFSLIQNVKRPVVLYFQASHFDSQGAITDSLLKEPRNLLQLKNGKPLELKYFSYRITPYTLQTDADIPVNRYRFEALRYLAERVKALPVPVQQRIVAITLAGELHQMFPDFENGMGAYDGIQVTDYSPASVAGFRTWLERKYRSIGQLNLQTGLKYRSFSSVQPPSKDIRKERLNSFGEHYDAFADGRLPFSGWLWDPEKKITRLDLYVDGQRVAEIPTGLNRLDVYRAEASITDANTGFRYDLDYRAMAIGKHRAQIIAETGAGRLQLAERDFSIIARDQSPGPSVVPASVKGLAAGDTIPSVRSWLDLPKPIQDLYFNPLARDWNAYRELQVRDFLAAFHNVAVRAGMPADKLYSHQIVPQVNSTWNPQLFAADLSMAADVPWKQGLNMYGGAADSKWMRSFLSDRKITDYGVPEFNPQQWKTKGVHLRALQSHLDGGARFVSPYYLSIIPAKFKGTEEHGVNRMEIGPDNPKDGSDAFYKALIEFARK